MIERQSPEEILRLLAEVKDPELPDIDVVELGIVRGTEWDGDTLRVDVTPTYSGCPAMRVIEEDIVRVLTSSGIPHVRVRTVFSPTWTTDWMEPSAREKLRAYGIAPPRPVHNEWVDIQSLVTLTRATLPMECPWCSSGQTELRSEFGATACKSIHYCNGCQQPFEEFKSF